MACGGGGDDAAVVIDAAMNDVDAAAPLSDATIPDGPPQVPAADAGPDAAPDASPDAMLGPETCDNGTDDNGDGKIDCADPLCANSFFPCQAPACPAGQGRVFYHATDLPQLIHAEQITSSTITVPAGGGVTNAAVKVSIGHDYVTDIVIHLTHLEGAETTTVDLSSNNGSVGHNYFQTVFSDSATTSVVAGTAPFTGVYRPEQPLSRFFHEIVGGAWRMDVTDSFNDQNPAIDDGGFAAFDLMLCVCTDCEVGPACTDHTDNDHDGQIDCADSDCGTNLRCVPETLCTDGIDNDLDNLVDCHDDQCNGHDHCEFAHEMSCGDGFDNDADGAVDCDDTDCASGPLCLIESNCSDHVDNDMDGQTDCDDPGCRAHGVGCQPVEVDCGDSVDNDGDGLVDCADPSCQVGLSCGAVPACPAGQSTLVLASTGSSVAIPDSDPAGASLTIGVPQTGTVQRVMVLVGITHTFDGDLTVDLIAPGVAAPGLSLADRVGSTGEGFTNTVFDDSATTAIGAGTAPYTGRFKPTQALSTLVGRPLAGTWRLFAQDNAASDTGTLDKFQLQICYTP